MSTKTLVSWFPVKSHSHTRASVCFFLFLFFFFFPQWHQTEGDCLARGHSLSVVPHIPPNPHTRSPFQQVLKNFINTSMTNEEDQCLVLGIRQTRNSHSLLWVLALVLVFVVVRFLVFRIRSFSAAYRLLAWQVKLQLFLRRAQPILALGRSGVVGELEEGHAGGRGGTFANPAMAVAQKTGTKMGCPGKWKHGCQNLRFAPPVQF